MTGALVFALAKTNHFPFPADSTLHSRRAARRNSFAWLILSV